MDLQIKEESRLGNSVVDTKSYLPLVAVKNGAVVHMSTDGFIELTNVPELHFPDSRFPFRVSLYEMDDYDGIEATLHKSFVMEAGRTQLELNESGAYYIEATIIIKENL